MSAPKPWLVGAVLLAVAAPRSVVWRPARPLQGSVVVIWVTPESLAIGNRTAPSLPVPKGIAAGEPLHFERADSPGVYWALAAVPLDAPDSVVLSLVVEHPAGPGDTLVVSLPVAERPSSVEALRGPPEFGAALDSALLERVADEREAVLAVRRRSHETPRLWTGSFLRPVRGRVTSDFGKGRVWEEGPGSPHDGVDLAGAAGTAVQAANRGVIALVDRQYYGGITVLIDHGGGLVTSYQHLSRATVAVGDTVARSQVMGSVGATGRVTGPHLHWGASYGKVLFDPLTLLMIDVRGTRAKDPI